MFNLNRVSIQHFKFKRSRNRILVQRRATQYEPHGQHNSCMDSCTLTFASPSLRGSWSAVDAMLLALSCRVRRVVGVPGREGGPLPSLTPRAIGEGERRVGFGLQYSCITYRDASHSPSNKQTGLRSTTGLS